MTKKDKQMHYDMAHTDSEDLTYTALGTILQEENGIEDGVTDGDTVKVSKLDFGNGLNLEDQILRFAGINTPELKKEEREAGLLVREVLIRMLKGNEKIWFKSLAKKDTWGRLLGTLHTKSGINLNKTLLTLGLAKVYKQGEHFNAKELKSVIKKAKLILKEMPK